MSTWVQIFRMFDFSHQQVTCDLEKPRKVLKSKKLNVPTQMLKVGRLRNYIDLECILRKKNNLTLDSIAISERIQLHCIVRGKIYPVKSLIWLCTQIQKQSPTCSKFLLESIENNHILRQNLGKFSSKTIMQGCSENYQKNDIDMYIFHLKNLLKYIHITKLLIT